MDESKASLYKKLATVMGDMNNIPKTGVNSYFKYKFVTAEAIADAVRQRLASQNVAFFASISKRELVAIPTGKTDKNGEIIMVNRWVIDFEFTFADGDTGATDTRLWSAEATADDDKGINKCATAAEKYFFLKTFIVNTGDEPDADAEGTQQSPNGVKRVTPNQPSAAVRGAGIQPTRPTPPPASLAANPAPSGDSGNPLLDDLEEQPVITAVRPDEDDPNRRDVDQIIVSRSGKSKLVAFAIVNSHNRIPVLGEHNLALLVGLPLNGEPIAERDSDGNIVVKLNVGTHDLDQEWGVYGVHDQDGWTLEKIETERIPLP